MHPKIVNLPNKILLETYMSVDVLDSQTGRVWILIWIHEESNLQVTEVTNPAVLEFARSRAFIFDNEKSLVLNPYNEMYEMHLKLSFDNPNRDLQVTLCERPFLCALDFRINSELVYHGKASDLYGLKGDTVDEKGNNRTPFDGTIVDRIPLFIDYSGQSN